MKKLSKILFNSFSLLILALGVVLVAFIFFKANFTLSKITVKSSSHHLPVYLLPELEDLPKPTSHQLNILLLGQRGEGEPFGGLLTDTLMLVSFNKKTGRLALISIPRDLYVPMPDSDKRDKLNAVYAWGYEKKGVALGMHYIEDMISRISGLYVDNAVVINFKAFKELINALGGIDIYLKQDFVEDKQWWCDAQGQHCRKFFLPKGKNHLDGETALFYVRSRFSSSDFDRARRQQQVLLAVKNKIFSLGFLANPFNITRLLDLLGNNVRTDMTKSEIKKVVSYVRNGQVDFSHLKTFVFDSSPEGLLYARYLNGRYILLPRSGDFRAIKKKCLELTR